MPEQNKTRRLFDLLAWIQKEPTGVSRERIVGEYGISEKTFLRDVEELEQILPFLIRFDREEQRLFARGARPADAVPSPVRSSAEGHGPGERVEELIEGKLNPFDRLRGGLPGGADDGVYVHLGDARKLSMTETEFTELFRAVVEGAWVGFRYHGKERQGVPLFFCLYAERWYCFTLVDGEAEVRKFRLDLIEKVRPHLVARAPSSEKLVALRKQSAERIRRSHNIFVDVSAREDLLAEIRFFFPQDRLLGEIGPVISHCLPDPQDDRVVDVKMSFSGYDEARAFLHKWLGSVQVLSPEALRARLREDLEEALELLGETP